METGRRCLVVGLAALVLIGCGDIQSREIAAGKYALDATGIYANERDMSAKARKGCSNGYRKLSDDRAPLATAELGPWWRWTIECAPQS
jgi:hypothetical protein